jgi:cell division transport system ATP-binding protein
MIRFENVTKSYDDDKPTLKNISFQITRGEMAYITGPSGAGKTTLLKLISLEEWAEDGTVYVDGEDAEEIPEDEVPYYRRKIGIVFQDFKLLYNRTVFENVALTLRVRKDKEHYIKLQVNETLKMVNLRHKSDAMPLTLSGGEQQRVAIARAIISEPIILLADEPTGNLDPDTSAGIVRIFKEINARGTTVLHATHDRDLFRGSGYRVFRIEGGNITLEEGL